MKTTRTIAALALWMGCTACLAQNPGLPPSAAETARQFDQAIEAYEHCHWLQSFDALASLASLADRGHAEAARIVMQMQRFGPALYGQQFAMTPEQGERWAAARSGRFGVHAARQ